MSAWIVTRSYDPAYIRDIETEAGEIVAQVLDLDDYASDLKRARLIAAAPDLLAALSDMINAFGHYCEGDPADDEIDALNKALAAIAKAEGIKA